MSRFAYELNPPPGPNLGLVVLQSDQRIELDFRRLLPENTPLYVTRVPSGRDVTRETLQQMEQDIPEAAALLPPPLKIQAVGYGCTSGAAQIGPDRVAELVRQGKETSAVSDPLSALCAACVRRWGSGDWRSCRPTSKAYRPGCATSCRPVGSKLR